MTLVTVTCVTLVTWTCDSCDRDYDSDCDLCDPTDSRLRRLGEEKNELEDQLRRLKLELEEERHMNARARISGSGSGAESDQVQREVARQVGEYRFKLQKADQDITNLQTAVSWRGGGGGTRGTCGGRSPVIVQ